MGLTIPGDWFVNPRVLDEFHKKYGGYPVGEIRDREKVMRGLKKSDTPIIQGIQIYHNYIKPHEGLDGKTPADACGIEIKGEDKWKTLIQNASHNKS